jgi:phytanoyl-CoA hydroxylase
MPDQHVSDGETHVAAAEQDMRFAPRGNVAPEEHIASTAADGSLISDADVEFWHRYGFLRVPQVFTPSEMDALDADLGWLMTDWAEPTAGWQGPWRRVLMDEKTEAASQLVAMHDLHHYSRKWMEAITKPSVGEALGKMIGPNVEVHHSTIHNKPAHTGHPFPMHQDQPFYAHEDPRYACALIHMDDTCHENGEIRFLPGSHRGGYIKHITAEDDGVSTPHLPTSSFKHADTSAVPANRGDVVFFNLFTVHGSYINQTGQPRRLVRVCYRNPENRQIHGQSMGRPGVIVHGVRPRRGGLAEPSQAQLEAGPEAWSSSAQAHPRL